MVRLRPSLELNYDIGEPGCDFIFNIHAAHTARQRVVEEALTLSQNVPTKVGTDAVTLNRCLRVHALAGPLIALCRAINFPARFTTGIDYSAGASPLPHLLPRLRRGLPRRPVVHVRPVRNGHPDGLRALRHRPRRGGRSLRDDH